MCTVSIIPFGSRGYRLVANRDEQRTRAEAHPPVRTTLGAEGRTAVWPVDPAGGGTWVGVNDLGLCAAALNLNEPADPSAAPRRSERSRGSIIPALLHRTSAAGAAVDLQGLELAGILPFRMVVVDEIEAWIARWTGAELTVERTDLRPICLASSGLGDALVAPRLDLFAREVMARGAGPETQDAFHAHRWPERPEISVSMDRRDARTVSRTWVEVGSRSITMRYEPVGGAPASISLERTPVRSGARG